MNGAAASTGAAVLVLDDDAEVRATIERILQADGMVTHGAASVSDAAALLRELPIDVVVCDLNLPDGSGIDLVRQLASRVDGPTIFMVTGSDRLDFAQEALDLGVIAYVTKPFTATEILVNARNAVRMRQLRQQQHANTEELHDKLLGRSLELSAALRLAQSASPDDHVVARLTGALTLRNEETGPHIERVSRYAAVLADGHPGAAWPPDLLRLATTLHDVGKIGVPDRVLLKRGRLSADEFALVRMHAELGYQLLADSRTPVLDLAASIALTHHERWDGAGYPRGLRGEAIPLEGRLVAVADVFDALTSTRVYRLAMPMNAAVAVVVAERGHHFDPDVVDVLVERQDDLLAIESVWPDPAVPRPTSVVIIDDHDMFAESIAALVSRDDGLLFLGSAPSAESGLHLVATRTPDVALVDWRLGDTDGITVAQSIVADHPGTKVILLTGSADDALVLDALRAGCAGFLTKTEGGDALLDAIHAAVAGKPVLPPARLLSLLAGLRGDGGQGAGRLTAREREVLALVARGLSNEAIAEKLFVSVSTVRNHVQNTMGKLGAHTRIAAVAAAAEAGLLSFP